MKYIELDGYELYIEKSRYFSGRLALQLWDAKDGGPYVTMTVNLPNYSLLEGDVILDTNNFPEVIELMEKYNLGKWTNNMAFSGFCAYPIYHLNMEEIEKYCVK